MSVNATVIGAGPYGLAATAYLRSAGVETKTFGEPMAFWANRMPEGMCLRSSWEASHIADPMGDLTLDTFRDREGNHIGKPIPLDRFVQYGLWYQKQAVPDLDSRHVTGIEQNGHGFKVALSDGEQFSTRRVVVAAGIETFAHRPELFKCLPSELASHTLDHKNLGKFKGKKVAVIGGGQSALESAALLQEAGAGPEVIVRRESLNWVGLHARLHRLGAFSKLLYSNRDVGPAGISRLVALPHLFRRLPRQFQNKVAYRAIRPAGAGWLLPRLKNVKISLGRKIVSARENAGRVHIKFGDGRECVVDHCLLATGFRVDLSRYPFLPSSILQQLQTVDGFPVLSRGFESSVKGLHFLGKPASWSFGPLLCFVSGTEFAGSELAGFIKN